MWELNDSLKSVKFTIKNQIISTLWERCIKNSNCYRLSTVGLIARVDFSIILGIKGMMERKYRRETIIEKCQVTISSLERLSITESILEEL
jgi:hypothetical protein